MKAGKIIWGFIGIVFIASVVLLANSRPTGEVIGDSQARSGAGSVQSQPVLISYKNLAAYLSSLSLIRDIPKGAVISLRFFNFNTGERQWEKSYILTTGSAREGIADKADIYLTLHSKYLNELNSANFCQIINQAKANGDLGFDSSLSALQLGWKFKSMYSYRNCLGF